MNRAFVLWMVIAVPAAVVLIGIPIVVAAFHLRAGYRGARFLLTVVGVISLIVVVFGIVGTAGLFSDVPIWLAFLVFGPGVAVMIAAIVLMWQEDATTYFDMMRARNQDQ